MRSPGLAYPDIRFASDHSVLVTLGNSISRDTHREVRRLFDLLVAQSIVGVSNIHPAYSSILISFDPRQTEAGQIIATVKSLCSQEEPVALPSEAAVEVPVCYDDEFAPDIADVAALHTLTVSDVIRRHTGVKYHVYFLGFSPGFPYLGELPDELAISRLPKPRVKVPAGSVAIGGHHTGIYPMDSPGGWRIIGRTPLRLFFPERNPPSLLQMGNVIQFVQITKNEYQKILLRENG